MFTIQGSCDWCNRYSLLTRHDYVDGMHHHSCEECHEMAKLDVKMFNSEETALRESSKQKAA